MKILRVAIIGFAHMHVNEFNQYIAENPAMELVGCADVQPDIPEIAPARYTRAWNLQNTCSNHHITPHADYSRMLDETRPDLVFGMCENARKPAVAEACASRGIPLCLEKPLAVSLAEALKIEAIARRYQSPIYVNWPTTWRPAVRQLKNALDSRIIGSLIKIRYLNGHTGPLGPGAQHRGVNASVETLSDEAKARTWWYQTGNGGAFLDILCYGCMYSRWFCPEQPSSVMAMGLNLNTPFTPVEDTAAAIVRFPSALSVIEATWTTPGAAIPAGPVLYGTEGVLTLDRENGSPVVKAIDIFGKPLDLPADEFPPEMRNFTWNYVHHLQTGAPLHQTVTLEQNLKVMALLDAAVASSAAGCAVPVEAAGAGECGRG